MKKKMFIENPLYLLSFSMCLKPFIVFTERCIYCCGILLVHEISVMRMNDIKVLIVKI